MDKLFNPASVAIIGLSGKPNNIPRLTLGNLLRWGYTGRIFGVNPRGSEDFVDGVRMVRDIADLPRVPDLVYALIPAKLVPDTVDRCGRFGVRRMAIPSGGFNEFGGEGSRLSEDVLNAARRHGIRFVGPNGLTLANTANGLCLPFAPLLKPPAGGISIVSQSGGVALMLMNFLKDENLGMAKFASIGNKLDLNELDYLRYLGQDAQTDIIFMYLESLVDGRALLEIADGIDKPIVLYKANTSSAGRKAAMSHTAAVSSDDALLDTALQGSGIIRIRQFSDFFAIAKAFRLPPMKGRRVMAMSPAGGVSVIMADLCEQAGFTFADPGQAFYDRLSRFAKAGIIRFSNPLDMGDVYDPQMVAEIICHVMHNDNVDGAFYISYTPRMPSGDNVFRTMFRTDLSKEAWGAIQSSSKPLAACLESPNLSQFKQAINVPIFNSPEELVRAMAVQMRFHTEKRSPLKAGRPPADLDMAAADTWLAGKSGDIGDDGLDLIGALGIPVIETATAADPEQAAQKAQQLGFPVVMKVISPDALHKTDAGGVVAAVVSAAQARQAFETIRDNLAAYDPKARFDGVRIQKTAGNGFDFFIGGKHDPTFGPVVCFGAGGIHMELYQDIAGALCPVDGATVLDKLKQLKTFKVLEGYRGTPPAERAALIDAVVRVSHLMAACPQVRELDINPIRVDAHGAVALDARMRLA